MARSKRAGRAAKRPKPTKAEGQDNSGQRSNQPKKGWDEIEKKNELFEQYYKKQGVVPEGEWDDFMAAFRTQLPIAFRVTGYKSQAQELLKIIKSKYFTELKDTEVEGKKIDPPKCMEWYPDGLACQINTSRTSVRRVPAFQKFHKFLISETESGNISRQEAVSMIPPLLMDIKPHHKILDMCAAPGSKTAQIIEQLHMDENLIPDGFVLANDVDNKRCYMMVHQVKRLQSPCFMIVNHDASRIPGVYLPNEDGEEVTVHFDRILADVPCSGDGTLRKNVDVWANWKTTNAYNLHGLQHRILKRGMELLEIGGRLVYSTCSLNPVEDEAVIASFLEVCEGKVELLDVSSELPKLKTTPGLKSWSLMSKDGEFYNSFDEVPQELQNTIRPTMFPPSQEVADKLNLERCMRVLPHHQDTGGFFIAVLKKTDALPWYTHNRGKLRKSRKEKDTEGSEKEESVQPSTTDTAPPSESAGTSDELPKNGNNTGESNKRKLSNSMAYTYRDLSPPPMKKAKRGKRQQGFTEDPFLFFDNTSSQDEICSKISKFFYMKADFPFGQLMVRRESGKSRNLYFASNMIKKIVQNNSDRLKMVNLGIKMFCRCENNFVDCEFRATQEGVEIVEPYADKRVVKVEVSDIVVLLTKENPFFSQFSQSVQDQLQPLYQGCIMFKYLPNPERPDLPQCPILLTAWRGKTSARAFIAKHERQHILLLCGVYTDEYELGRDMDKEPKVTDEPTASIAKETTTTEEATDGNNKTIPETTDVAT